MNAFILSLVLISQSNVPYFNHINFKKLENEPLSLISFVQSKYVNNFMMSYKKTLNSEFPNCSCKQFYFPGNQKKHDYHMSHCFRNEANKFYLDGLLDVYNFLYDEMWILNLGENIIGFRPLETKEKSDLIVEERFPWKEFIYSTPYINNPTFKDIRVDLHYFCMRFMEQSHENFTIDESLKDIFIEVPLRYRGSENHTRKFEIRISNQLNDTFVETLKMLRQYVKILEEPNDPTISTKNPLGMPYKYKNKYIILPL